MSPISDAIVTAQSTPSLTSLAVSVDPSEKGWLAKVARAALATLAEHGFDSISARLAEDLEGLEADAEKLLAISSFVSLDFRHTDKVDLSTVGETLTYRGNHARTGAYSGPAPRKAPSILWSFDAQDDVDSSPVIYDGLVYFGSDNARLYAVDVATGELAWIGETDRAIYDSPAIDDGCVYCCDNNAKIYAFDAKTGERNWEFESDGTSVSTPAAHNGTVYFSTDNASLCALAAKTGDVLWSKKLEGPAPACPTIYGGQIFIGTDDGHIYAFDATMGRKIWADQISGGVEEAAVVSNGRVIFPSETSIRARDIKSGKEVWSYLGSILLAAPLIVYNGVVYVFDFEGHLYAIDEETGYQLWCVEVDGGRIISDPAACDGLIIFTTSDRRMHAVDAKTGTVVWELCLDEDICSAIAIVDGIIYCGTRSGHFLALKEQEQAPPQESVKSFSGMFANIKKYFIQRFLM